MNFGLSRVAPGGVGVAVVTGPGAGSWPGPLSLAVVISRSPAAAAASFWPGRHALASHKAHYPEPFPPFLQVNLRIACLLPLVTRTP